MKVILTIISLLLFVFTAGATEQWPDTLILKGKSYELEYCYPLEPYFELHPEQRPEDHIGCTCLYRYYVATYELRNDSLYVVDIEVPYNDTGDWIMNGPYWVSVIDRIFPRQEDRWIEWSSEILVIPPVTTYIPIGKEEWEFKIIDDHYRFLEVQKGVVVKLVTVARKKYDAYKTKMFVAFKRTSDYQMLRNKHESESEFYFDEWVRDLIVYYAKYLVDK
jgi:hypothetical protein